MAGQIEYEGGSGFEFALQLANPALSTAGSAVCFALTDFGLGELLSGMGFRPNTATNRLLNSFSVDEFIIKASTAAVVNFAGGGSTCGQVERGVFVSVRNLRVLGLTVPWACFKVSKEGMNLEASTNAFSLGPVQVGASSHVCFRDNNLPGEKVPAAACSPPPGVSVGTGPKVRIALSITKPDFLVEVSGSISVFSTSLSVCIQYTPTRYQMSGQFVIGGATFEAQISAPIKIPNFVRGVVASPATTSSSDASVSVTMKGRFDVKTIMQPLLDLLKSLSKPLADAKRALKRARTSLDSAQRDLDNAKASANKKFNSAQTEVNNKQNEANAVACNCRCGVFNVGCWARCASCNVVKGVKLAALAVAKEALGVAQKAVNTGFSALNGCVSSARNVLKSAESALNGLQVLSFFADFLLPVCLFVCFFACFLLRYV